MSSGILLLLLVGQRCTTTLNLVVCRQLRQSFKDLNIPIRCAYGFVSSSTWQVALQARLPRGLIYNMALEQPVDCPELRDATLPWPLHGLRAELVQLASWRLACELRGRDLQEGRIVEPVLVRLVDANRIDLLIELARTAAAVINWHGLIARLVRKPNQEAALQWILDLSQERDIKVSLSDLEAARTYLGHRPDLQLLDVLGLHAAVTQQLTELVQQLLQIGCRLSISALVQCGGSRDSLMQLLAAGVRPSRLDAVALLERGWSDLVPVLLPTEVDSIAIFPSALHCGNVDLVSQLLPKITWRCCLSQWAAASGSLELLEWIFNQQLPVDGCAFAGAMLCENFEEVVEFLVREGCSLRCLSEANEHPSNLIEAALVSGRLGALRWALLHAEPSQREQVDWQPCSRELFSPLLSYKTPRIPTALLELMLEAKVGQYCPSFTCALADHWDSALLRKALSGAYLYDTSLLAQLSHKADLDTMKWISELPAPCPWHKACYQHATDNHDEEMKAWLWRTEAPVAASLWKFHRETGSVLCESTPGCSIKIQFRGARRFVFLPPLGNNWLVRAWPGGFSAQSQAGNPVFLALEGRIECEVSGGILLVPLVVGFALAKHCRRGLRGFEQSRAELKRLRWAYGQAKEGLEEPQAVKPSPPQT